MFDADKTRMMGYRMVKKLWPYVKPFSSDTRTSRTDRQTDGRTDRIAVSISRVIVLTRDKNYWKGGAQAAFSCRMCCFLLDLDERVHSLISVALLWSILVLSTIFSKIYLLQSLTSSTAFADRPRDALCLSVVSFNSTIRRAQSSIIGCFGFWFTAAYS